VEALKNMLNTNRTIDDIIIYNNYFNLNRALIINPRRPVFVLDNSR
jgi:hypothetical protein